MSSKVSSKNTDSKVDESNKTTTKKSKSNAPSREEQFKKKSLHQHILDLPDTYIGSVEKVDSNLWLLNDTSDKIIESNINIF